MEQQAIKMSELQQKLAPFIQDQIQAGLKPLNDAAALPATLERLLGNRVASGPVRADEPGIMFSRMLMAVAAKKVMPELSTAEWSAKRWGKDIGDEISLAMGTNVGTAGGYIVPSRFSDDFVELLRPANVVMRMVGPDGVIRMEGGNLTIAKQTGGATASYVGENQKVNASQPTLGNVNLVFKSLRCIVALSNSLIRQSSPNAERFVRRDAVRAVANRADLAFISGDGLQDTPKGLLNLALAANKFNSGGTTLALVDTDLHNALGRLEDNNVPMTNVGWLMHPRLKRSLMKFRTDGNAGAWAYRDEMMEEGTLLGYPFAITTQIPGTAGSAKLYAVDFDDVVIGEALALQVRTSDEAAYHDENGNLVSAYDLDQTVVRIITEHDINTRRGESIAVVEAISW